MDTDTPFSAAKLSEMYKPAAKERQKESGEHYGKGAKVPRSDEEPNDFRGEAMAQAAKEMKVLHPEFIIILGLTNTT